MSPAAKVKLFFSSLSYLRYILNQMRIVKDKNVLWFCALFSVYHLFEMPYISFTNHTSCFHSTLVGDSFSLCWFEFWHFRASSFWRLFGAESFSSLVEPQPLAVCSVTQWCPALCDPMNCSWPGSSPPWDFPDENTAVGCHFLLQGVFQSQDPTHISCVPCFGG